MPTLIVAVHVTDTDFADGWGGDVAELAASIQATLHELNGDNGDVFVPDVAVAVAD